MSKLADSLVSLNIPVISQERYEQWVEEKKSFLPDPNWLYRRKVVERIMGHAIPWMTGAFAIIASAIGLIGVTIGLLDQSFPYRKLSIGLAILGPGVFVFWVIVIMFLVRCTRYPATYTREILADPDQNLPYWVLEIRKKLSQEMSDYELWWGVGTLFGTRLSVQYKTLFLTCVGRNLSASLESYPIATWDRNGNAVRI